MLLGGVGLGAPWGGSRVGGVPTLDAEHLPQLKGSPSHPAERGHDPLSVGFRKEGAGVQWGAGS